MRVINVFLMSLNYIIQYMNNLRSHTDLCMYRFMCVYWPYMLCMHVLTRKGFKILDPN